MLYSNGHGMNRAISIPVNPLTIYNSRKCASSILDGKHYSSGLGLAGGWRRMDKAHFFPLMLTFSYFFFHYFWRIFTVCTQLFTEMDWLWTIPEWGFR